MKKERNKPSEKFFLRLAILGKQIIRFILSRYFITFIILLCEVLLVEHLVYIISENFLVTKQAKKVATGPNTQSMIPKGLAKLDIKQPRVSPGIAAGVKIGKTVKASLNLNCTPEKARFILAAT